MNKAQLVDAVAERMGNRRVAAEAVDAVLDTITRAVVDGQRVSVTGFGTFERLERAARLARNPQTGGKVAVKAKAVPNFRPGQGFKDLVSGGRKLPTGTAIKKAPKGSLTGGRTNMPAPAGSPRARAQARNTRAARRSA